jgi:hypothetical protein
MRKPAPAPNAPDSPWPAPTLTQPTKPTRADKRLAKFQAKHDTGVRVYDTGFVSAPGHKPSRLIGLSIARRTYVQHARRGLVLDWHTYNTLAHEALVTMVTEDWVFATRDIDESAMLGFAMRHGVRVNES